MTTMKTMKTLPKKAPPKKRLPHFHFLMYRLTPSATSGRFRRPGRCLERLEPPVSSERAEDMEVTESRPYCICSWQGKGAKPCNFTHLTPTQTGLSSTSKHPKKKRVVRTLGPKSINFKKVGNGNGTPGNLCTSISTAFCEDSAEPRLELCREPWRMAPVAERRRPAWMLVWEPENHDCR